ncbi:MAG TPA: hypothetical protein VHG31_06595 [Stellaceae bacterium]|jgi:hypothetical protein|nr:hypothetical protein [Stellaceae bacterium]
MAVKFVVGLFSSKGIAEDACNRLRTEGVPAHDIALLMLRQTAPASEVETVQDELAALSVDPLVIGNTRDTFAPYIRNGETAVFVRAHSEADVELASGTIRQYAPIRIEVGWIEEGAARAHKLL